MSSLGWITSSVINTAATVANPMITPWLNDYAVGSGIITAYFMGTAAIAVVVSILATGGIQLPEPWVLLAGLFFGAGILGIQKATERAPEPAIAMAIPTSRAFFTSVLAYLVLGATTSFSLGVTYIVQVLLCLALAFTTPNPKHRNEKSPWTDYAMVATVLLSVSDIILKQSGSYDTVIGDTTWFAIAGAIVPAVVNHAKTDSFFPEFREKDAVDHPKWWFTLGAMVLVFYIRVVTQVLAVSLAPNPALPRMVESFAVPVVAFLAWKSGRYRVTLNESVLLTLMTVVSMVSGYVSYIQ